MDDELKKSNLLSDNDATGSRQLNASNLVSSQEGRPPTKEELARVLFRLKTKETRRCIGLFIKTLLNATFTDSVHFSFAVSTIPLYWYYAALSPEQQKEFWLVPAYQGIRGEPHHHSLPDVIRSPKKSNKRRKVLKRYLKELKKSRTRDKAFLRQPGTFEFKLEKYEYTRKKWLTASYPAGKYQKRVIPELKDSSTVVPVARKEPRELSFAKTQYSTIEYNRAKVGESPARPNRHGARRLKYRRIRRRIRILKKRRPGRFLHTQARAVGEKVTVRDSLYVVPVTTKRIPRWQEKRPALLHQAVRQRQKIRQKLGPTKVISFDWKKLYKGEPEPTGSSIYWRSLQFQGGKIQHDDLKPPIVGLPFDVTGWTNEPENLSQLVRAERLKAPLTGPRLIPRSLHNSRILLHLRGGERATIAKLPYRLAGESGRELALSYASVGEMGSEEANVRLAEADFEAKKLRYYRSLALHSRRPGRTARLGDFTLGRRPRPRVSPTMRPKRRRDRRSLAVFSQVSSLKLGPLPEKAKHAQEARLRLPRRRQQAAAPKVWDQVYETHQDLVGPRAQVWGRYRLGANPRLAQARYRWWCKWHALDPWCFAEVGRQGKKINNHIGRENTGWWRFLAPRQRDRVNKHKGKGRQEKAKPGARHVWTSFNSPPIDVWEADVWNDSRKVPFGWGALVRNNWNKVRETDWFGNQKPAPVLPTYQPFFAQVGAWNEQTIRLAPFTLSFLVGSIQIRYFSFKVVQEDFLFALGLLLKTEGAIERDPAWRFWLLEAFGLTRKRAAIQIYEPDGDRNLLRSVGWSNRDLPFFRYRLSWLRELHHGYKPRGNEGPRPTVLVGTPGAGKTSRVRIFADESKTPILYQSLNAFTEATKTFTSVGVGKNTSANSVKRGFIEARRRTPVIYFRDELDALGAKRADTFNDNPEITLPDARLEDLEKEFDETPDKRDDRYFYSQRIEQDRTKEPDRVFGLTQLLKELDSPEKNKGILFIGATNRPQALDRALIRPGRFSNVRVIEPPNRSKRLAILKLYTGRLRASVAVDWQFLAARTAMYNGAHLACLANQAGRQAILYSQGPGTPTIQNRHFDKALRLLRDNTSIQQKTMPERTRDAAELTQWERLAKAYYRAAAAVVSWSLKGDEGLAGVVLEFGKLPIDPKHYETKPQRYETRLDQRNNLAVYRAGRASLTALQCTWAPDISKATEKAAYTLLDSREALRQARSLVNIKYQKWTLSYAKEIEFTDDHETGKYLVQQENTGRFEPHAKTDPAPETALKTAYSAWDQPEWVSEWLLFEGAEYNNGRAHTWLPPELHVGDPRQFGPKLKLGPDGNVTPKYCEEYAFNYIGNAYRKALKVLNSNRVTLDLYAAFLLKNGTLPRKTGKKLAPGLWEKTERDDTRTT